MDELEEMDQPVPTHGGSGGTFEFDFDALEELDEGGNEDEKSRQEEEEEEARRKSAEEERRRASQETKQRAKKEAESERRRAQEAAKESEKVQEYRHKVSTSGFTFERGLRLQQELIEGFSSHWFQQQFVELTRVHPPGNKRYEPQRLKLLLTVQSIVLPKYGFEGTSKGAFIMQAAYKAEPWEPDEEIQRNGVLLGELVNKPLETSSDLGNASTKLADRSTFTLEIGMSLQQDLLAGFSDPWFQKQLDEILEKFHSDSSQLALEKQRLAMTVQSIVLPKYGFDDTHKGVAQMARAFASANWKDHEEVNRTGLAIVNLLNGIKDGAHIPVQDTQGEHPAAARCREEAGRRVKPWQLVSHEHLLANYAKQAPGMRYGIKFPHSADLLLSSDYGAPWLTKAFQAAGTLSLDNRVKQILRTKPLNSGGAAAKLIVDVEYQTPMHDLHTRLFVKYPFPCEGKTRSDRMQISVNQQPGDVAEVDTYRVLEAGLPFRIPKYYFADISNESTNYILITEFIPYGDAGKNKADFAPFEIEPAYRKYYDDEQFDNALEYYTTMTKLNATMAAWYKLGRLGDRNFLAQLFPDLTKFGPTPLSDAEFKTKMDHAEDFLTLRARQIFPDGLITDTNMVEWRRILTTANQYRAFLGSVPGRREEYNAIMHINMNVDNTWWWRDEKNKLCMGALDWGGLCKSAVGLKLWWSYYGAEFHMLRDHLDDLLQIFADTYEQEGGPKIHAEELRRHIFFGALEQNIGLLGSVPQIYRVIRKEDWPQVTRYRSDQRLIDNYLQWMYVNGFVLITQLMFECNFSKLLDDLIVSL